MISSSYFLSENLLDQVESITWAIHDLKLTSWLTNTPQAKPKQHKRQTSHHTFLLQLQPNQQNPKPSSIQPPKTSPEIANNDDIYGEKQQPCEPSAMELRQHMANKPKLHHDFVPCLVRRIKWTPTESCFQIWQDSLFFDNHSLLLFVYIYWLLCIAFVLMFVLLVWLLN